MAVPLALLLRWPTPPKYMVVARSPSNSMTSVMAAVPRWAASLPARTFMERVGSTRTMPGASASTTEFTLAYASSMAFPEGTSICTALSATPVRASTPGGDKHHFVGHAAGAGAQGAGGGGGFSDNACFHVHITFPTGPL